MRVVIQRVLEASVTIEGQVKGSIQQGLLVFLGIENEDSHQDVDWLCSKISKLRIFADESGVMNKSIIDVNGAMLLISQFTLHASTKKGNRPSYIKAARPEVAVPLYQKFITSIQTILKSTVATGEFGADMKVSLVNDGPVTIVIDTKNKE